MHKAIQAGLEFKKLEKREGGQTVTMGTINAYHTFNGYINLLSEEEKDFVNVEVRRLNK